MHLPRRLSVLLGATAALAVGSGLIALTDDAVVSEDNEVTSVELRGDLQVGFTSGFGADPADCGGWSDDLLQPMDLSSDTGTAGVLEPGISLFQENNFCLRNAGSIPMGVFAQFTNLVSTDLGCGWGEAGCTPGSPGYLEYSLQVSAYDGQGTNLATMRAKSDDTFEETWANPAAWLWDQNMLELDPGEVVVVYFEFLWLTEDAGLPGLPSLSQSQSDRLQWDVAFDSRML